MSPSTTSPLGNELRDLRIDFLKSINSKVKRYGEANITERDKSSYLRMLRDELVTAVALNMLDESVFDQTDMVADLCRRFKVKTTTSAIACLG